MPIGPNGPDYTDLDYPQVLQRVFEESEDRLRVDAEVTAVIGVVEVVITDTNDSIKIGNGLGVFADVDASRNLTVRDNDANTTLSSIDSQLSSGITVNAVQSGAWSTGRTWVLDDSTDSVTVIQGTSPWIISGTVAATQSGTWTTGRTWVLDNSTDSVESFQGGLWDVSVNNFPAVQPVSGTVTALQGTSPWVISGTVAATQSGAWTTGRTWTLSSGTDSVNIGNFPATQSVTQGTTPWIVDGSGFTQPVSGTVTVNQGTSPWVVSGTITTSPDVNVHDGTGVSISSTGSSLNVNITNIVPVSQSGTWTTGRTWTLSSGTDSVAAVQSGTWVLGANSGVDIGDVTVNNGAGAAAVNIQDGGNSITVDGTVTVLQGTSPWVISGTVTTTTLNDTNYGVVGANTLRTAAQIGNATGAADFGAGTTTAQTLRVVLPTDQTAIPVTQSGTWTTGRTWTLASGTDSVTVVQGTSPWVISGAVTLPYDTNYGTVGANTLRTASQIGNSTGAADFNAGATGAQTLRVTANAGVNLNTSALALNTTVAALQVTQGSTTAGQSGTLVQGAVTTNAPTYTTAQTSPLSLTTGGALRVDEVGFSTASNTRPSITNANNVILAANAGRKYVNIFNQSGANIFIKLGAAAVINEGIRLANNEMFEINKDNLWLGTVNVIKSGAAAVNIEVFEGTL